MNADTLTQSRLKELLHYDPETGIFTRLNSTTNRVKVGCVAGTVSIYGYRVICINYKGYKAHRLAFLYMEGELPPEEVDHLNGHRDDNRWGNLRHANKSENMKNQKIRSDNASGVIGVRWYARTGRWIADIYEDGRSKHLGYFADKSSAIDARKRAEIKNAYHVNHGRRA